MHDQHEPPREDRRNPFQNNAHDFFRSMGRLEGQLSSLEAYLRSRDMEVDKRFDAVDARLSHLEKVESRAMGGATVISIIVGAIAWILNYMK